MFRLAERIAVLPRGRQVGVRSEQETARNEIVSMITGWHDDDMTTTSGTVPGELMRREIAEQPDRWLGLVADWGPLIPLRCLAPELALRKGFDPDRPAGLTKTTRTS